jgi:hypothetical protein
MTQRLDASSARLVWLIFGVLGVASMLFAMTTALRTRTFLGQAVTGTATVIELVRKVDNDSMTNHSTAAFYPVFRFVADDGRTYTVQSHSGSRPPSFEVNEQVPIRYLRDRPASAQISSFWQLWLVPVVLAALGGGFVLMAVLGIALSR